MAFKLVSGFPEHFAVECPVTAGTAIQAGEVLAINGNVLERATASSTIHTIWGVSAESISTSASAIKVIPITDSQIWEADCKNNTASNQLFESAILEDHDSLDNTSSDVTGPTGVFTPFALVGAAANKKVLGRFTILQSTST